jgi:undecaprenyl phosphate N,N'-diacetylbacillosamine 1-phosphate transferase
MPSQGSRTTVSDAPFNLVYRELVEISLSFRLLHRLGLISPRCRPHAVRGLYVRFGKRALDIVAAVIILVLVSPILFVLALVSARIHGKPVFFRQMRIGHGEAKFRVFKFRSMTNERDADGRLLPDEARLTSFGLLMRKWSADELPQFLNVLSGQMGLIGPRPLLMRYVPRYSMRQRRRHTVKPGISGLAQVLGKDGMSWEQRLEADVAYANSVSFILDVAVIILTLLELGRRIADASMTTPELEEFWGRQGRPAHEPLRLPVSESGD